MHRAPDVDPGESLAALGALEHAYRFLVKVLRLPAPLGDHGIGTTDALDLYLKHDGPPGLVTNTDLPLNGAWDSAPTFCMVRSPERLTLPRVATQCVGEAIVNRLDPAATPDFRRALATEYWWIIQGLDSLDIEQIGRLQAHPERGLATRELDPVSEGRALLLDYLDTRLGFQGPGELVTLLAALAASVTPANAHHWRNEPDTFDVLWHTLDNKPSRIAELFGNLAVDRAFAGDQDGGSHWPTLASIGSLARLHYDWRIPWSSLPRRLAPGRPLEPLGSMYVWLDLDDIPLQATLGFQAEWEAPVSMQWMLVRLGRDGRELSRVAVPYQERGTMVEQRLVDLAEATAVLIVGINLGGTDLAHPFDPDLAPFEPHGCTVFLASL